MISRSLALLLVSGLELAAQIPAHWLTEPVLPEATRRGQMYAYVNANIPPLPQFRSLPEWERYRVTVKRDLLRLLGIDDILRTHRLQVVKKGTLQRKGYRIDKIVYESYPGMYVPALVWRPDQVGAKAPAIVSITGHTYCDSKAADYIQARNYNLVRRGFIVVSYDYFGCGERGRLDACQPGVWGGVDHTNSLFSYTTRTPTGIEVLDGIRAVDYLYSLPEVDRSRIAFTGESGGGNNTYWVAALDERVTAAVTVCAAGSMAQWIKADLNYDWHQRPPGLRAFADIGTLYALTAPRPLLVLNGHKDLAEFAWPDAERSVDYARAVYRLYGAADRIALERSTTDHGYQLDKRLRLYDWLGRWYFAGKTPGGAAEIDAPVEPREALHVGLSEGLSIPELAKRWVDETRQEVPLPANANDARTFQEDRRQSLAKLLGLRQWGEKPGVAERQTDVIAEGDQEAERLIFEMEPDLLVPAVFVRPAGRKRYPVVIVLEKKRGSSAEVRELLREGAAVLLLDPRGAGEMDWGGGRTSNWANLTGRTAAGMWAEDVSRVTTYLLARPDVERIAVLGYGIFGKAALYATALDSRISAAALAIDTISYRTEAEAGFAHVYADVPRILAWGDTPQIAALVAPRALAILRAGEPVSSNQERLSYFSPMPRFDAGPPWVAEAELRDAYSWTQKFYAVFGAASRLRLGASGELETAQWLVAGP